MPHAGSPEKDVQDGLGRTKKIRRLSAAQQPISIVCLVVYTGVTMFTIAPRSHNGITSLTFLFVYFFPLMSTEPLIRASWAIVHLSPIPNHLVHCEGQVDLLITQENFDCISRTKNQIYIVHCFPQMLHSYLVA